MRLLTIMKNRLKYSGGDDYVTCPFTGKKCTTTCAYFNIRDNQSKRYCKLFCTDVCIGKVVANA
jgi:hypothetical protein